MKKSNLILIILALVYASNMKFSFGQNELHGRVVYYDTLQTPISGVDVYLKTIDNKVLSTTVTDTAGNFLFSNLTSDQYLVTASTDQDPPPSVDLYDISQFIDWLNNEVEFENIQLLAADVTGNFTIDSTDLRYIMENWFLNGEGFPVGDWVFEEKLVDINGKEDANILGNQTANTKDRKNPDKKENEILICTKDETLVYDSRLMSIPINSTYVGPITSFYIEIRYEHNKFDVINIESDLHNFYSSIKEDRIKIIWADNSGKGQMMDTYNDLLLITIDNFSNSIIGHQSFTVVNKSYFICPNDNQCSNLYLFYPKVKPALSEAIFQNSPNPVNFSTTFNYSLPFYGNVSMQIIDINGKIIKILNPGYQDKGSQEYKVNDINLKSGLYAVRLFVDEIYINTCKLIVN